MFEHRFNFVPCDDNQMHQNASNYIRLTKLQLRRYTLNFGRATLSSNCSETKAGIQDNTTNRKNKMNEIYTHFCLQGSKQNLKVLFIPQGHYSNFQFLRGVVNEKM